MRRVLTLAFAITAALALAAPGALAGGYDVYACDGAVAGGANNSFAAIADGGMTAK